MNEHFPLFAKTVNERFQYLVANYELFTVEVPDIFEQYLAAFPEGSNPLFRERTEHDCNCCKQFIRRIGNVVALENGNIYSVWDTSRDLPAPYNLVAFQLRAAIITQQISGIFRTKENSYSVEKNYDPQLKINWHHFYSGKIPNRFSVSNPATQIGKANSDFQVGYRGLCEISLSAIDSVLDLISDNNLYRGEEHKHRLLAFKNLKEKFDNSRDFVWEHLHDHSITIRNTSIGTLLTDISGGEDLEVAVHKFEAMVAPQNYKRPKSLITQSMIDKALADLHAEGMETAIERRFATIEDISVNNVLFVDNTVENLMQGGSLRELLMEEVKLPTKFSTKDAVPISIDSFMQMPFNKLQLYIENKHLNNFVSLTTAKHNDAPNLFKWDNNFAWIYDGDVADSIKERVKRAGGNVTNAALRISLAWHNRDDLDIHISQPHGETIYYGNKQNLLDVDMNVNNPVRDAVENVSWRYMPRDGVYSVFVNTYTRRESHDIGCIIEVEYQGNIRQFVYDKPVGRMVGMLEAEIKGGQLTDLRCHNGLKEANTSQQKWGINTQTLVPVDTIMMSPNHWNSQGVGNRHWFFMLKGCKNPEQARGFMNEYLDSSFEKHRKVFEVLGSKLKCEHSDEQLSGVGFSSTRHDKVYAVADGKPYEIIF